MTLSRRERMFLVVGVALVALAAGGEWFVRPVWSRWQEVRRRAERSERQVASVTRLVARYRRNRNRLANLEKRLIRPGDGFSLFSYLEEAAGRARVRNRLVAMNPSEDERTGPYRRLEVRLRFEDLTMPQLVRYLQEIEKVPRLVRIDRLSVERSARLPGRVRAQITVAAFSLPGARQNR